MLSLLSNPWVWKMAWRESRGSRKRLLLSLTTVTLGIAALIAVSSFERNVRDAINAQAKSLLGADLVISSRQPFSPAAEALIRSIGGDQSREVRFASMVYFPKNEGTRLVQVRALAGHFPYYGMLETIPDTAAQTFQTGPYAIVDDGLMLQFDGDLGDTITIGAFDFSMIGRLKKIPGEAAVATLIGPRVYIPLAYLEQTDLIQQGSQVSYRVYFRFDSAVDIVQLLAQIESQLVQYHLESETVQKRAASLGRVMENLSRFLDLVGFVALLLGGVGVASAIHTYVKQKFSTIALFRCLGARVQQTFAVYVVQATVIGCGGAVFGALVGISVQTVLPVILHDFLPVRMTFALAWDAIAQGVAIGWGMTILFALLPLLSVRKVSPLLTLRLSYENAGRRPQDPLRWCVALLIILSIGAFALSRTERWIYGVGFLVTLLVVCGFLAMVAQLLMVMVGRYFPRSWTYVWRQGLANLYRPNNHTVLLLVALGLGTFLIVTLALTHSMLLKQVALADEDNKPNLMLFDIQVDQKGEVADLIRSFALPVLQQVPIVTMRLATIKGRSVEELYTDPHSSLPEWALRWEYRVTYREYLSDTETLVAGVWQGRADPSSMSIPISLEEEIARTLAVTLGDEIVFDVQGVPIATTVSSLRRVDWQRVQPNFFVVFPAGVLEDAPQFFVLVSKADTNDLSAALQRAVVRQFPNVSVIDLNIILQTVEAMLSKVAFALRFMALFSVVTGLIVLASAVVNSRAQRLQENVLLRTLGASRAQLHRIMVVEYLFLGCFAAACGSILALLASWGLAYFLFETVFAPTLSSILVLLMLVIGLTLMIGLLGNRGVCNRPPLVVLRSEG
jgi:putative ABC transport system permease protein